MPIYEYECQKCRKAIEVMQKFSDAPITTCEECGGDMKKLISNTSFVLKGSGWYVTDYASNKNKTTNKTDKCAGDKKTETSTETKSGPKSESASEAKTSKEATSTKQND
ncbi:MAG: zinc ribbon domain-containing protein [Nitrospirae bacterium]|nr:MAG: zinc ribbon domain-containing protein [Nitrospirota bacterium]